MTISTAASRGSGRVYIYYALEEIQRGLNCGHDKAVKLLAELDAGKGVGLIERIRQGQGRPAKIYVKQFTTAEIPPQPVSPSPSAEPEPRLPESRSQDFGITETKTSENQKSRLPENRSADFGKSEGNYNNIIYPYMSYLDPSIYPSQGPPIRQMDRQECREAVKEHIAYQQLAEKYERDEIDEILELITDALCSTRPTLRIGGEERTIPREICTATMQALQKISMVIRLLCWTSEIPLGQGIAKDFYGYQIAVLDLRNPTRSDGNNLLHLINKYMDIYKANPNDLAAKAKAEKYSKILAKTLINTSGGDSAQYGQNAFFYDSAEGLLTAMFLLVAEYLPTEDENGNPVEKRHIVSVFKLVQELLAPSKVKGKNQFQILLEKLPPNHKARWFAGSALNTAEQAMASVISTVLSRLNAFLDSEMEQILCFDTAIDAEKFCNEKSAIFIVLPEEDQTKYFMVSLILQNLYREILTVADENGGRLKNRVVFFADELGTCPPIQSLELMFSASRSRGLMLVPIVQSITGQLKKNYGAEGAEVIVDNCQVNLYGGFAPASQTAVELSKALGSRTVMSGSISRGKNDPSQSLQMIERPLMTPDELKSMPKGSFIVAKTGVHPMKVKLRLFLDWGIRFGEPYEVPEKAQRAVAYADKQELEESIIRRHYGTVAEEEPPQDVPAAVGGMNHGMQAEKNSRKTILRP